MSGSFTGRTGRRVPDNKKERTALEGRETKPAYWLGQDPGNMDGRAAKEQKR